MKKIAMMTALILFASMTSAADFQGKVVQVKGDRVTIQIFGDKTFRGKAGESVSIKTLPGHLPTLDMLQG